MRKERKFYNLDGEKVFLNIEKYSMFGNTAIQAVNSDFEPYAPLTVNLCPLIDKELAYINVNLFGIDVEKFITENGLGVKIEGAERKSGFVTYPLYKLNLKKLQE